MSDPKSRIGQQVQGPQPKAAHDNAAGTWAEVAQALIAARVESNMTQKELAKRSGVRQSNISRIESGMCSPTLATLQALAQGLDKKLVISFK